MALVALLSFGAVARLTRLLTADTITAPIRNAIRRRYGAESAAASFIECPWCVSVWIAAPVAPLAYWFGLNWWYQVPALWLTLGYATGWAAVREEPAVREVPAS